MSGAVRIPSRVAVRLMLMAQGLDRRPRRRATRADVLEAVRRMGVLQIDTIHVVARSPYLVLWSRLGAYDPAWLDELLEEGHLFEYWGHEASLLPIEAYPLLRHRMIDPGSLGWKYSHDWIEANRAVVDRVLAAIRDNGPIRSADFERKTGPGGSWWGWKPEKRALELLFTAGHLMISRRERFQRVYDLRERVLPGWTDDDLPSVEAAENALVHKTVEALGIAQRGWIADYFRMPKARASRAVHGLIESGRLVEVQVAGWPETGLVAADSLGRLEDAREAGIAPSHTTLLSPFDPLVWDRARARAMFGFEYRLECYTPAAKRRFGYFVLPILRRGRLVGRLDAKAHRVDGLMEIRSVWLEEGVRPSAALLNDLARTLVEFAEWHATPALRIKRSVPAGIARELRAAVGTAEAAR